MCLLLLLLPPFTRGILHHPTPRTGVKVQKVTFFPKDWGEKFNVFRNRKSVGFPPKTGECSDTLFRLGAAAVPSGSFYINADILDSIRIGQNSARTRFRRCGTST